jgi:hypothetical protein
MCVGRCQFLVKRDKSIGHLYEGMKKILGTLYEDMRAIVGTLYENLTTAMGILYEDRQKYREFYMKT